MQKVLFLFGLTVGMTAIASASVIYGAGDNNQLYTINPTTGVTTPLGSMGVTMFDIAEFNGKLYGIDSSSELYSINPSTAAATPIGATGQSFNALTFNSAGVLYAAGVDTKDMYTINTSTGAATKVPGEATQPSSYNTAGDLEFFGGVLYVTTQPGTNSILDTVNLATGALTPVGTNLGFTNVYGLAKVGGVLYGFTDNDGSSEVITINTTTGAGTAVVAFGGTGRNAFGFNGTTDEAAPEPGTLGVMALGLAGLGGIAYRRRRA
jgi:PEP-CTERM motif